MPQALLRVAALQYSASAETIAEKLKRVCNSVCGKLEGEEIKLNMDRIREIMRSDEEFVKQRRASNKVKNMWNEFSELEVDDRYQLNTVQYNEEASFMRALKMVEEEGNLAHEARSKKLNKTLRVAVALGGKKGGSKGKGKRCPAES